MSSDRLTQLRAAIAGDDHRTVELIALAAVKELERRDKARTTWLTPISDAYDAEMGAGTFPFGQGAKALSGLYRAGHAPETIAGHLGMYLRSLKRRGEVKYLSLPRFAQTFNEWNPDEPAFDDDPL